MTALLPKEHGAYGQMAFPVVTAMVIADARLSSTLLAAAVVAGFLFHEPLLVLLGHRGARARREHAGMAAAWSAIVGSIMVAAGVGALATLPLQHRWTVMLPAIPAAVLFVAAVTGRERSSWAQVSGAVAFSLTSVPVCLAAGVTAVTAGIIASAFAVNFVLATLAVRVVILRARAGGNLHASRITARWVFAIAAATAGGLLMAFISGQLPPLALVAFAPGIVTTTLLAAAPPPASRLRSVGWRLITASAMTSLLLIATY